MSIIHAARWILLSVLILSMLNAVPAFALGWGPVRCLAIDPNTPTTLYASTCGVWKSVDGGATWDVIGITSGEWCLFTDPVTPTTLYATGWGHIAHSTDGGATWSGVSVGGPDVFNLLIDPVSPSTLYANVWGRSVLKSTDGGASWIEKGPVNYVTGFAIDASASLYALGYNVGDPAVSVFESTNGGANWTRQGDFPANGFLVADPVTPANLFARTEFALFKSTDGGKNWRAVGPSVEIIATNPLTPTTLYASRTDYTMQSEWLCGVDPTECLVPTAFIYKSTDSGEKWTEVTVLPGRPVGTLDVDPRTPTTLYAGGWGVLKSTDGGATWSVPQPPSVPPPPTDTTAPDTSITLARDGTGSVLANDAVTVSTSVTFSFSGIDNVGLSRFECQLNRGGFSLCASPLAHTLALGHHTFEVRAIDTSGNVDPTPALFSWTVDVPPDTSITSAIDGRGKSIANGGSTSSDKITFRFDGTDNGTVASFECRLDAAANFTSCTSPVTYTGVTRGAHTFRVRAVDNNGFRDPTPAVRNWTR